MAVWTALALGLLWPASAEAGVFGFLEPPAAVSVGAGPFGLLDFDGDALVDIAGVRLVEGRPQAYLRRGTDTGFAPLQSVALGDQVVFDRAARVAVGDVTGDGLDDVVVVLDSEARLIVLRGRADGVLAAPGAGDVDALSAPMRPRGAAVALGDLDGDGDLDAVAAIRNGDENSSGPPVPNVTSAITVLANGGNGDFSQAQTLEVQGPSDLALVELAGDADLDLVVAQHTAVADSSVQVFAGAGGAAFGAGVTYPGGLGPNALAVGDFNADGRADVAVGHDWFHARRSVSILAGTPAPAGLAEPVVVPGADGGQLAAGDLDLDGRDDLYVADSPALWGDTTDDGVFLRGLGSLAFAAPVRGDTPLERFEAAPVVADVDGDDKPDVVTSGAAGRADPGSVLIRYGAGPQLVPDADWVNFGDAPGERTVTFTNAGGGIAGDIERVLTGATRDFVVTEDRCATATLQIGESCALKLRFGPEHAGFSEAQVSQFAADSELGWVAWLTGSVQTLPHRPPVQPDPARPIPLVASAPAPVIGPPSVGRPTRKALARRGLRFSQRLPAGRVRWTLELKRVVLGSASRTLSRPRVVRSTLRLSAAGRRTLARRRPTRLVLRTRVTHGGKVIELTTPVRVRR